MTRERRTRAYHVPEEAAWHLLSPRWLLPDVASFHFFEGVPDDLTVDAVWHDPLRRAFTFVLSHPSFEAVPEGELTPSGGAGAWETVRLRRAADGEALAYGALREENRTMRLILGDMIADEDRIRAAYELGRRDFEREARGVSAAGASLGAALWPVGFAPAESLQDGEAVTVGPDGLWRRAGPGDPILGHVRYHGGTAYVHGTQS